MNRDSVDLKGARILLVDDVPANLEVLRELLEGEGYEISLAPGGEIALRIVREAEERPDLILLDVMMPGMDGYEVCRRLKADARTEEIPVIFITAQDQTESVVRGFETGGVDYIPKPFRGEEVLARVQTHLRLSRLTRELARKNRELEEEIERRKALSGQLSMLSEREASRWGLEDFVGQSPTVQRIFAEIRALQERAATSVLIVGERGTGKELIGRSIHYGSARRAAPFVVVECAEMPEDVVGSLEQRTRVLSMLFGHARAAFPGADEERDGFFQMAHGGTLFFSEIGEIPLPMQSHLLRVLQSGEVRRVGEKEGRRVDVRVLASTSADLEERVRAGAFRKDFFDFLSQATVVVPPLRRRPEDIPLLARHFLRRVVEGMGQAPPVLSDEALARLRSYSFPENVRELKEMVERALLECGGGRIEARHLRFAGE